MKAGKNVLRIYSITIMIMIMVPLTGLVSAQTAASAPPSTTAKKRTASAKQANTTVTVKEVQELKEAVSAQQQQIRQ